MNNNKIIGIAFEREMCELLATRGYWVHFITPDNRGTQPFDIIAVKEGKAFALDCKTLAERNKSFNFSRLEDNQVFAFEKWLACGNSTPMIVIKWRGEVYVVDYLTLKEKKSIKMEEVKHEQF